METFGTALFLDFSDRLLLYFTFPPFSLSLIIIPIALWRGIPSGFFRPRTTLTSRIKLIQGPNYCGSD